MNVIDYICFNDSAQKASLVTFIKEKINTSNKGYCIVENKLLDASLFMLMLHETLAPSLSLSQKDGVKIPFDVVKDKGEQMGKPGTILSATNQLFPLHTDCCFLEKPADFIALYCVENSDTGGENTLLNINCVIPLLPHIYLQYLLTTNFLFYSKEYKILEKTANTFFVRFHQGELMESCPTQKKEKCIADLQPLLALLEDPVHYTTVKLQPNQCLIVNNRTCLHGRFAFEAGSKRTFYRLRHYINKIAFPYLL
ncbi:MAG: TauD/TfdA family dioxygenase [Chitinophagaceae bacterium]|nr:TauD/TfdA family dioxygenase [Chitinophagaceae bacterium]